MVSIYSQKTDRDLVLACQRREPQAFEELVRRHQKNVYSLLFQIAPEWTDITELSQEAFIRVWRNINNLRNPSSFRSWLTQIVISLFYDEYKNRSRRIAFKKVDEDSEEVEVLPVEALPTELNGSEESSPESQEEEENHLKLADARLLRKAMVKLPEQFRTALVLREMEGLNYEEIAVLTRTEMGTVKSRIAQGRNQLQKMLQTRLEAGLKTAVEIGVE
jgi:RNA polymerase sigma-70 factor (ECF subfamily)